MLDSVLAGLRGRLPGANTSCTRSETHSSRSPLLPRFWSRSKPPPAAAVRTGASERAEVPHADRKPSPPAEGARQMWVWHLNKPAMLMRTAKKAKIRVLLVWVSPGFSIDQTVMRKLRTTERLAQRNHVALHALCGDPSWVTNDVAPAEWAHEVASVHIFSALHLDIEPQSLPQWPAHQKELALGLLSALAAASTEHLPVEADIPAWFNRVTVEGAPLDQKILAVTSSVTIMAYQNTAEGVLTAAQPELQSRRSGRSPCIRWAQSGPTNGDAPTTTFLGESIPRIKKSVSAVQRDAHHYTSFAGLALHDAKYVQADLAAFR